MRTLILFCILLTSKYFIFGQELLLNETTGFYEFNKVQENSDSILFLKFKNRLNDINYKNISIQENFISGEGFTNHLVGGFATVEIKYIVKIAFKEGKYKITLTNFILSDKNGNNPLEGMGSFKKKWINIINEKLPEIVKNLQDFNSNEDL